MPNAPHKEPQYGLRISSEIMDKLKYCDIDKKRRILQMIDLL